MTLRLLFFFSTRSPNNEKVPEREGIDENTLSRGHGRIPAAFILWKQAKRNFTWSKCWPSVMLFSNKTESEKGNPADVDLSKSETQVPLPPIKRDAIESADVRHMKECMLLGESYISQVSVISLSTFCIRVVVIRQISLPINRLQQFFYSGLMTPADLLSSGNFCNMML